MSRELPVLLVYLVNAETGAVKWKPKGATHWQKARSVYEASRLADEVMATPRIIEYLER